MLHFSCDLCGKDLTDNVDGRFVVRMEVFAAHDPGQLVDDDLSDDQLEAIGQLLRDTDDETDLEPAPAFKKLQFDLCSGCHKKFLADPLNRESQKFDFSEN
jgi:hypothetical protein